ncbi:SDR family NAD(P)-dependent oxidoreductase [Candidatus Poriferisocius sp.]|uniref:SDR family NAD(P)-dependent oxidoreductase n=1 Tax=Candidatus Poriferisocius sp. TaxID=3101276 RepID=UPI003B0130E6
MGRLDNRVVVITGSGDGIGYGIARRFAAEGATLLITDIDAAAADRVGNELRDDFGAETRSMRVDVSVKDEVLNMVSAAVDGWGRLDVLINNAWGGGELGRVEIKTDQLMNDAMHVGLFGPLWAMQAAFRVMRDQRYGRVVNLCSLNGVNAHMGTLEYNCAKEALRTLSRTAAREWAPYGIVVNVICPGAKTASARRVEKMMPDLIRNAEAANPMGRMGDPEADIAPVALFLSTEDARYLTGNTLYVDGGSHINGASWVPDLPETG